MKGVKQINEWYGPVVGNRIDGKKVCLVVQKHSEYQA